MPYTDDHVVIVIVFTKDKLLLFIDKIFTEKNIPIQNNIILIKFIKTLLKYT